MSGFRGEAADNRVFMADLDFTHDTTHTQHINTPSLPAFRTKLSYYWTHYFFKQQRQLYTEKMFQLTFYACVMSTSCASKRMMIQKLLEPPNLCEPI